MIFFLGISLPQVASESAPADFDWKDFAETLKQCQWVIKSWKAMGKTTSLDPIQPHDCCYQKGSEIHESGIPGVFCNSENVVTEINWKNQGLKGSVPIEMGNLNHLKVL
jgi:hypothetical protein